MFHPANQARTRGQSSRRARAEGSGRPARPPLPEQRGGHPRRALGKAEGITATAHKLARVIYAMIASGRRYDEAEAFRTNPGVEQKRLKSLKALAAKLGFQLVPNPTPTMS